MFEVEQQKKKIKDKEEKIKKRVEKKTEFKSQEAARTQVVIHQNDSNVIICQYPKAVY